MKILQIKSSELKTTKWAGGTTTQLAIYPSNAQYKNRDFKFRLSTANIESEESTFTMMPDVRRKLMILDGEIKIVFNEMQPRIIRKFDQVEFQGAWHTKSYGTGIDFNLMTKDQTFGEIESFTSNGKVKKVITNDSKYNFVVVYAYKGQLSLGINEENYKIGQGDVCIIQGDSGQFFKTIIETDGSSEIIITYINSQ